MKYSWMWEQFEERPDYLRKHMFGCQAVYLRGLLMFCVSDRRDPWCGLLCATSHEHHSSLMRDFPGLKPHAVLRKWLHLDGARDGFESQAQTVLDAIQRGDARIGVLPGTRVKKPSGRKGS